MYFKLLVKFNHLFFIIFIFAVWRLSNISLAVHQEFEVRLILLITYYLLLIGNDKIFDKKH